MPGPNPNPSLNPNPNPNHILNPNRNDASSALVVPDCVVVLLNKGIVYNKKTRDSIKDAIRKFQRKVFFVFSEAYVAGVKVGSDPGPNPEL